MGFIAGLLTHSISRGVQLNRLQIWAVWADEGLADNGSIWTRLAIRPTWHRYWGLGEVDGRD